MIIETRPEYNFEIEINGSLTGFALDAGRGGKDVRVAQRHFFTAYDGEIFYTILDEISKMFLRDWMLREKKKVSSIDNSLIFIGADNKAKVYINVPALADLISKGKIERGSVVTTEDIADIRKINFPGIQIESNSGVIYIFSQGWMRGLYFDFMPIQPQSTYKTGDLESLFASLHSYLLFPEVYRIEPQVREQMFNSGWFPFIRILGWRFKKIYEAIKYDFLLEEEAIKVVESFDDKSIRKMLDAWMTKDLFRKHETFIKKGIEEFIERDYISAIHILYPRIEGLMRYIYLGEKEKPILMRLVDKLTTITKEKSVNYNLYFPDDFSDYLKQFYFSSFDLDKGEIDLSRHSLAHGVARVEDFSKIGAFQAILILDQIFYYI